MTKSQDSKLPDADMQGAPRALARAARRAREIARRTGTAVVVRHEGKLIEEEVRSDRDDDT